MHSGTLCGQQVRDWACLQETRHRPLRRALLGALGPLAGVRLLDVGCGVGLLLREAAERGAWVAGVDTAEELLEVARWALPDADLRVSPLESLPHANGRFDLATACNTLRYAADQAAALAELARVVRPGGLVAIGDWADPEDSLSREFLDRLGACQHLLEPHVLALGLDRLDSSELDFLLTYPDLATAWSAMAARGCVALEIHLAGEESVYEHFLDVFTPAVRPDGSIREENAFYYMVARKPL